MLVVPVAAPISTKVAAPAILTVVAFVLTRLIEVCVVSRLPPFRLMSPATVTSPIEEVPSIESVVPPVRFNSPASILIVDPPVAEYEAAAPDATNGPKIVPPDVALTNPSTYCLVAACKGSVGSA